MNLAKNLIGKWTKRLFCPLNGKVRRYRKVSLSDSEIMTVLIVFQFVSFRDFKHYYPFFIRQHMKDSFLNAVSYNRFVELESQVVLPDDVLPQPLSLRALYGHQLC